MRGVALVGKMHAGKSTIAAELVRSHGYVRLALADGVKDDAVSVLNFWLELNGHEPGLDRDELEENKGRFRALLQWLGTEWGREYVGPETIWIDRLRETARGIAAPIVCDDCRFPNEADALRRMGFLIVRVERDEIDRAASVFDAGAIGIAGHASETELYAIAADLVTHNADLTAVPHLAAGIAALVRNGMPVIAGGEAL